MQAMKGCGESWPWPFCKRWPTWALVKQLTGFQEKAQPLVSSGMKLRTSWRRRMSVFLRREGEVSITRPCLTEEKALSQYQ